jgi:hypothetical protein
MLSIDHPWFGLQLSMMVGATVCLAATVSFWAACSAQR